MVLYLHMYVFVYVIYNVSIESIFYSYGKVQIRFLVYGLLCVYICIFILFIDKRIFVILILLLVYHKTNRTK